MNYLSYYGLTHNPFNKETNVNVETLDYKEMTIRLKSLVEVKGIGLFTGAPGSGKTHTLRTFSQSLNQGLYKVCYFSMSSLTAMDFYRSLAHGLNLEPVFRKVDLFRQIQNRIEDLHDNQRITPVIILDEAQYLNPTVLQDITMLLNFEMDSKNKCTLILAGLPHLGTTLTRSAYEPLRQRIIKNYQIVGINKEDLITYVETKLQKAGRITPLFDSNAYEALDSYAQGSTRKLNNLISQALIMGALQNKQEITAEDIFQANNEMTII